MSIHLKYLGHSRYILIRFPGAYEAGKTAAEMGVNLTAEAAQKAKEGGEQVGHMAGAAYEKTKETLESGAHAAKEAAQGVWVWVCICVWLGAGGGGGRVYVWRMGSRWRTWPVRRMRRPKRYWRAVPRPQRRLRKVRVLGI